ncbi:MAG: hypothetical protein IH786_10430, partial [Proteobacteria bacterium]|nr:hypothetical protein [Pseudomonadota bacterium]
GWRTSLAHWTEGAPALPAPQLIEGDALDPIIACDQGVLLGSLNLPDSAGRTYVLADPDDTLAQPEREQRVAPGMQAGGPAIGAQLENLGKACGSCHKPFRAKK